jgi:hypothetical protein
LPSAPPSYEMSSEKFWFIDFDILIKYVILKTKYIIIL